MRCEEKKAFPTRRKAELALRTIWRKSWNQAHKRPHRSYKCELCGKWHLTSQTDKYPASTSST